jgi:hypothetical protein
VPEVRTLKIFSRRRAKAGRGPRRPRGGPEAMNSNFELSPILDGTGLIDHLTALLRCIALLINHASRQNIV